MTTTATVLSHPSGNHTVESLAGTRRSRRQAIVGLAGAMAAAVAVPAAAQGRQKRARALSRDAMVRELERQFDRAAKSMREAKPDAAARAASAFTLLAAFIEQNGLDADMKTVIRDEVRRSGRDGLIDMVTTFDRAADVQARGLTLPPTPVDVTDRLQTDKAVAFIEANGIAAAFRAMADDIERNASKLSNVVPVRQNCHGAWFMSNLTHTSTILLCLIDTVFCFVVGGAAVVWDWYRWYTIGC